MKRFLLGLLAVAAAGELATVYGSDVVPGPSGGCQRCD